MITHQYSDLREIYDELRGNKPMMSVSDLNDWADVQDMLSNNIMDAGDDTTISMCLISPLSSHSLSQHTLTGHIPLAILHYHV